jgi:hypothetical protein
MTRKEEIKNKADIYADKHGFRVPYDGSNNFYDETDVKASIEGFVEGAKYADKTMIEKACKLYRDELLQFNSLLSTLNPDYDGLVDVEKSLKSFKKAMEGGEE